MSHITGTIQVLGTPLAIGPGTTHFAPPAAPGGTKLLILHFQNLNFLPGDQLQVNLGYDLDVFTAADGPSFWTRPIDVYAFPMGVAVTYVPAGPPGGSVELDRYGRGERHAGEPGHPSFSNCDPFFQPPSYLEPTYDPFWYCADPPNWDNSACTAPPADVRAQIARSVGMILSPEGDTLSTCSVTLVDSDKVITAGHCHTPAQALDSSVTFDYRTECDGTRPPGYNPRFYKVKAVLAHKNTGSAFDYSLLQLAQAPVGIPAIQMRHDLPVLSEAVFGIHHPNGAVKKLSIPQPQGFAPVTGSGSGGINVPSSFHVSGGSSGSGLFDAAGRICGVLSRGDPCNPNPSFNFPLTYCPTKNILEDTVPAPPPPVTRDLMLVFDRSGSMSMDDGFGRSKIEAARDAVSLFVQLVRAGTGNRAGLVSFSTTASSPVDFAIANVTAGTKTSLVGPPPYSAGIVGGLTPGGFTSIGGGLDAARAQLAGAGPNPNALLLLTDGLQNRPPPAEGIDLSGIDVHAIGFGTESSLDGDLLSALATSHGGQYMRAGGGLALEKFFSSAFGNIFETGVLFDPEHDLPAGQSGDPIPFRVCGEERLTAVAGWDRTDASLVLQVTTPGGATITATTAGVEGVSGRTWTFLRIPLPLGGERDGAWGVRVLRPGGGSEFPPPTPALRYFVNIIPTGGPRLTRLADRRRYYTGDAINPMVIARYPDGGWPEGMQVSMTVTRPNAGVGNLLSQAGLGAAGSIDGDGIPARQATLRAIEAATGKPAVQYVDTDFDLADDARNTGGLFEGGSTFGRAMSDLLTMEGNYSFHAKATYGGDCSGMRELVWSVHVDVGIDPVGTTVSTTPLGTGPDGRPCVRMTFTPRDRYGNLLGPGRADGFTLVPYEGSTPSGPVTDLGNGAYEVDVCSDPDSLDPPKVGVVQPGRPTAPIGPLTIALFMYSVKFLCGVQRGDCCDCAPVRPGRYSTEINIHNPGSEPAPLLKRVIPLVLAGAVAGREPRARGPAADRKLTLPGHGATMDDCCALTEMLLGAPPVGPIPLTIGILEIVSRVELEVTAVYTASGDDGTPAIEVKRIEAHRLTRR